jgi:hypothetical protein
MGYLTGSFVLQNMFCVFTRPVRPILILTDDVVSKSCILVPRGDPSDGQMNCCSKVEK